ncbi:NAD-dependent protein deacetylase Sirt2 [Culicoides brevitarsis]|uniref:NAD-dependent protein deacetylase Sirt2 n=1 Tax=Culicoides brevitarsis TaxID=469753 RepID=UPI00307B28CE
MWIFTFKKLYSNKLVHQLYWKSLSAASNNRISRDSVLNVAYPIKVTLKMNDEEEKKELNPSDGKGNTPPASGSHLITEKIEQIRNFLSEKLHLYSEPDGEFVLESVDIHGVLKHWKKGGFKKIVTMVGAGISTSAGIKDFRSPDGLYNTLKFNLPYPEAIFDLSYFMENPKPFFQLAKELYPGTFKPTPTHYFIKLLHDKGFLVRHYTQNIDTLDRLVGLPEDKIVEAHGTFYTNHCLECQKEYSMEWVKTKIFDDQVPRCLECDGVVKPDIVFFGENLPEKFHTLPDQDFKECQLLLVMGTSLTVQPFAGLVDYAPDDCVRLLINREKVGGGTGFFRLKAFGEGLCFDLPGNRRDVAFEGDCDECCKYIAEKLGFLDELEALINSNQEGTSNAIDIKKDEVAPKKAATNEECKPV